MSDDPKKRIDADTLLAFREGLLSADEQQRVEERLRFSGEDRDELAAFDRDLEFMKSAVAHGEDVSATLMAIRTKIQSANHRTRVVRRLTAAAAVIALVAGGLFVAQGWRTNTLPRQASADSAEIERLQAAVAELEYETDLLRAQLDQSRMASNATRYREPAPRYAETAAILLEAARYWEKEGADPDLSKARYAEILAHFPDSTAAAAIVKEKPAVLFGSKPL